MELSFPGAKVPLMELSLPGAKVPGSESSIIHVDNGAGEAGEASDVFSHTRVILYSLTCDDFVLQIKKLWSLKHDLIAYTHR